MHLSKNKRPLNWQSYPARSGDTSRIQMLAALVEGEQNVGALAEQAGISESATSHYLRHLRQIRLVRALGLIKGFTFGKKHLGSPY